MLKQSVREAPPPAVLLRQLTGLHYVSALFGIYSSLPSHEHLCFSTRAQPTTAGPISREASCCELNEPKLK